jgi:hypothetical protein
LLLLAMLWLLLLLLLLLLLNVQSSFNVRLQALQFLLFPDAWRRYFASKFLASRRTEIPRLVS